MVETEEAAAAVAVAMGVDCIEQAVRAGAVAFAVVVVVAGVQVTVCAGPPLYH